MRDTISVQTMRFYLFCYQCEVFAGKLACITDNVMRIIDKQDDTRAAFKRCFGKINRTESLHGILKLKML